MTIRTPLLALLALTVFVPRAWGADPAAASQPETSAPAVVPAPPAPAPPSSPAAPATKPVPQEESYSYVSGYSDGCASANLRYARQEHVKPNRDPKLYESDADYRAGWDHGYRKCEDKVTPGGIAIPGNSIVL